MMQTTGGVAGQNVQKVRVYEMAKDVGLTNKDLVDKIRALGIEVKNHMSALEPDDVARVRRAIEKERHENTVVERIQPTVIRRRSKGGPGEGVEAPRAAGPARSEGTVASSEARRRVSIEDILPHRGPKPAPPPEPEPEVEAEPEHEAVAEEPAAPPPVVERAPETLVVAEPPPPPPQPELRAARPEPQPEPPRHVEPQRPAPPPLRTAPPPVEARSTPPAPVAERPRAKTQFEVELERARAEAAAKQAALAAQKAAEAPPPATPGRPAVGSIIELP